MVEVIARPDSVNTPCAAYNIMAAGWELSKDLLGGTPTMRAAGKKWLPMEEKEEPLAYSNRLGRSILYEALKDTREKLVSKPFTKPIHLEGLKLQAPLDSIFDDADRAGTSLEEFLRRVLEDGVTYGLAHILVDFPATGGLQNAKQEQSGEVSPYFCRINPENLIGWKSGRNATGEDVLTEIRIREIVVEDDGEWNTKEVIYVRVIRPDTWLYYRIEEKTDVQVASGINSLGKIPLKTFYTKQTGFMTAEPPLSGLAWLNLAHWQSYSDQRNILRFSRIALLFMKGITSDEQDKSQTIGPAQMIKSVNKDADLKYVEPTGAAIGAGRQDCLDLEAKMQVLGLQPLMEQSNNTTAMARGLDESRTQSKLSGWVRLLQGIILDCYQIAAEWLDAQIPDGFNVYIFSEFSISMQSGLDIQNLVVVWQSGGLSTQQLLAELQRRGSLSDSMIIEDEIKASNAEQHLVAARTGKVSKQEEARPSIPSSSSMGTEGPTLPITH